MAGTLHVSVRLLRNSLALVCAVALWAGLVAGEQPEPEPAPAPAPVPVPATAPGPDEKPLDLHFLDFLVPKYPRPTWHLVGGFEAVPAAGFTDAGSRPTVGSETTEFGFGYKQWRVTWKRTTFDFNFHGATVFGPSNGFPNPPALIGHGRDPWQALNTLSVGYFDFNGWKPTWWTLWGVGLGANFEKDLTNSFGAFGMFQFVHQFDTDWKVNFGILLAVTPLHVAPLPMFGLVYHKDTKSGWSITVGFPELIVAYHFNEQWQVRTHVVELSGDSYRLADHNPIAPKGSVELKGAKTGLEVEWNPRHDLSVVLGAKYLFSRQWVLHTVTQHHKEKINLNDAADVSLRMEWGF